ncbi:MAG: hypothetical protein ABJA66_10460, partial [Actinomycetota bacterium]
AITTMIHENNLGKIGKIRFYSSMAVPNRHYFVWRFSFKISFLTKTVFRLYLTNLTPLIGDKRFFRRRSWQPPRR